MHRHQYKGRKLSREAGPRKALVRGLASQVILYEKVSTTLEKAKQVQPVVEKLITRAKSGTLNDRRIAAKTLSSQDRALEKLFAELGPLYAGRNGGYTRVIKIESRIGDNASMAVLELLDTEKLTEKVMKEKAVKTKSKSAESKEKPAEKKNVAKKVTRKATTRKAHSKEAK